MTRDTVAGLSQTADTNQVKTRAFKLLKEIRSVSLATINGNKPAVRIVSISAIKDDRIYLLAPRGKPLYHQIRMNPDIAICGMTPDFIVVRVEGTLTFMKDRSFLEKLIENKAGMYTDKTDILEMFYLEKGTGEIFDLSSGLPMRLPFAFGGAEPKEQGYRITEACIACGLCKEACTCDAVVEGEIYSIDPVRCLHCGRCYEVCPEQAIEKVNIVPRAVK